MAWQKNGTPITLSSSSDDMDITDLTALKFNQFLQHFIAVTGLVTADLTLDNTGGNDYTRRNSTNGGSDSTVTSQAFVESGLGGIAAGQQTFTVFYTINITSEEKLSIYFNIASGAAGAGTAPSRAEGVWKKDTTTDTGQFTRIDLNNTDAGSFDTDSNLSALGTD